LALEREIGDGDRGEADRHEPDRLAGEPLRSPEPGRGAEQHRRPVRDEVDQEEPPSRVEVPRFERIAARDEERAEEAERDEDGGRIDPVGRARVGVPGVCDVPEPAEEERRLRDGEDHAGDAGEGGADQAEQGGDDA